MIKSALSNISMYYMSVQDALKGGDDHLKRPKGLSLGRWLTKKFHPVELDVVVKDKENGGLGVGRVKERNLALKGK